MQTSKTISVKKPGKMYLAGEYAVLYQQPAVLMPTSNTLNLRIHFHRHFQIDQYVFFVDPNGEITHEMPYVKQAIEITHRYLIELGVDLKPYYMHLKSNLRINGLPKLGLGSSAAVTTAIIDGILRLFEMKLSSLSIYKLAVLAQIKTYPQSSYGDIACSAFGHWIYYKMFDRNWLLDHLEHLISHLLEIDWSGLVIEKIRPTSIPMMIIYSGYPAISSDYVEKIKAHDQNPLFKSFLMSASENTMGLKEGLIHNDLDKVLKSIQNAHNDFLMLEAFTHVNLYTQEMKEIHQMVIENQGVAKPSGAGGGDCMVACFKNLNDLEQAKNQISQKYLIITQMIRRT